jgi:IclR family acetate operon transcriptional repressor
MVETAMVSPKVVQAILKGGEILRTLADGVERISDLSQEVGLSKSTTHRLLKSLEAASLVMQDPITRRYFVGPLMLELASRPLVAHQNLTVCAFDEMRSLRDFSRETVVLHIRVGLERICLEELPGLENIRYTAGKGFSAPIYTGSAGKVLLSELKENELELLLKNLQLRPIGPNTITDKKTLLKELDKVRKQGYATSFGERIQGSASISVPVRHYVCPVALSVLGPDNRFTMKTMMDVLKRMKESAERISEKLASAHPGSR